jgi:hypothetical protein
MPLSRQVVPGDQAGRENFAQPRLRAAAFDRREPVTRRAAALEALFRTDWQRSAPRSRSNLALTAESYLRARIVVEHVLAPKLTAPLTLLAARYA